MFSGRRSAAAAFGRLAWQGVVAALFGGFTLFSLVPCRPLCVPQIHTGSGPLGPSAVYTYEVIHDDFVPTHLGSKLRRPAGRFLPESLRPRVSALNFYVASLRPEERLLLAVLSGARLDAPAPDGVDWQGVDWQRFETLVAQHAVLPLVYKRLSAHAQNVPEALLSALRRQAQLNVGFSLRLAKLLLDLVALLEGNGVPTVAFKGPGLAVTAYGDLGLRPFSDLDIFVQKKDLARARTLLEQRGFRHAVSVPDRSEPEALGQRMAYHDAFTNSADDLVELHWEIAPSFFASALLSGFWERARPVTVLGQPLRCFSPEDQLLLLCVHGSKHRWERLGWVCDVALLLNREPPVWPELWGRARQLGAERMLLLGVRLAHELLGAPVPEAASQRWHRVPELERLTEDVRQRLFSRSGVSTMSVPRFYLHLQARPGDRLRLMLYLLRGKLR